MLIMKEVLKIRVGPHASEKEKWDHELALFNGLHQLFLMIDINCDGGVSWAEFASYLINFSVDRNGANFEIRDNNKLQKSSANLLRIAHVMRQPTFEVSQTHVDAITHCAPLNQVLLFKETDMLYVLEKGQKIIRCCEARSYHIWQNNPVKLTQSKTIRPLFPQKAQTSIMSFAMNQNEGIALATSHGFMYFYHHRIKQNRQTQMKLYRVLCSCEQTVQMDIWYTHGHQRWWTAGLDNILNSWVVTKSKTRTTPSLVCPRCTKKYETESENQPMTHEVSIQVERACNADYQYLQP